MPRFRLIHVLALALMPLFSCDNTVDINADWKETIVVYCLLDPIDTAQYVRIEKAYLDEKHSALVGAKITDSLYLDSVLVTLVPENGAEIVLTRTMEILKDSGLFGNDKNPLWRTSELIDPNRKYTLNVVNLRTGTRITAETRTVAPAFIQAPIKSSSSVFSIFPEFITIEFTPKANSFTYDVKLEFYYDEFRRDDTMNKVTKKAVWSILTNFAVDPTLQNSALARVPRQAFLQFLSSTIKSDSMLLHRVRWINMIFYGGNQTLSDYISVNQPSIGIVQKTAEYTNIQGGYGIFASRCIQAVKGAKMDSGSINMLITNSETKKLNFIR